VEAKKQMAFAVQVEWLLPGLGTTLRTIYGQMRRDRKAPLGRKRHQRKLLDFLILNLLTEGLQV
jgi:hypothetical protein